MDPIVLTSSLYNYYKVSITAYMILPTVTKGYKENQYAVTMNPVLYFRYKGGKDEVVDFNKSAYKVNLRNMYRTIKFFNRAVSWFYDNDLTDLFLTDDNGALIFNSDYNKLRVITDPDPYTNTAMKIVPGVISTEDGKTHEGVYLYINKPEYAVPIPLVELENILGILKQTSFDALATGLMDSYFINACMNRIQQNQNMQYQSSNNTYDQWKK